MVINTLKSLISYIHKDKILSILTLFCVILCCTVVYYRLSHYITFEHFANADTNTVATTATANANTTTYTDLNTQAVQTEQVFDAANVKTVVTGNINDILSGSSNSTDPTYKKNILTILKEHIKINNIIHIIHSNLVSQDYGITLNLDVIVDHIITSLIALNPDIKQSPEQQLDVFETRLKSILKNLFKCGIYCKFYEICLHKILKTIN
mgnify:CR=1 FL=1